MTCSPRWHWLLLLGVLLATLVGARPAVAQSRALEIAEPAVIRTSPQKRVALVIGNSAYEHAAALPNPRNDARDISVALLELGFEVVDGYDLGTRAMEETLRRFAKALDGAGVGLFFYAGHGLQVDGRNYMVPVDAELDTKDDLEFEAIDMNRVLAQLERQPRVSVIMLDACRNNPLAEELARALRGHTRSVGSEGGLSAIEAAAPGTLIAFATEPGNVASDGNGRNSPFTAAWLEHIRTPGLELQAMMRRVTADVLRATDGQQVPWQNASLTTDVYLSGAPSGKPKASQVAEGVSASRVEIELWMDVKDSGSIDELEAYLAKYPQGAFGDVARSRIKGLELEKEQPGGAGSIEALYALLSKRSIVIEDPQEPHEFYHNARLYDLRGDALNASKMYARYVEFGLPYVDPHLRYQTYLKATEGRAGAREAYNELAYDHQNDEVLGFAAALLQPKDTRIQRLEAFVAKHPEFGPAYYELSLDYSFRRLGAQTLEEKRKERAHLQRFLELLDQGEVYRFFLDKAVAQEKVDEARERLSAVQGIGEALLDQPILFTVSRSGTGWTVTASPMDAGYTDVEMALPGKDFRSLGTLPYVNPMTGKPMAKTYTELPPSASEMTLRFRYRDGRGQLQGPFEYDFDPAAELRKGARNMLEMTSNGWVSTRDYAGKRLLYFTMLLGQRCAIDEVRYGLNGAPDRTYDLPDCDPDRPYEMPDGVPGYMEIPGDTRFVTVQLTWYDGTTSDVVRIDHRP